MTEQDLLDKLFLQFVSAGDEEILTTIWSFGEGLVDAFADCDAATAESEAAAGISERNGGKCMLFDENTELAYAEFFFDDAASSYAFDTPKITAANAEKGVAPSVSDFWVDDEELEGVFTVDFACSASAKGKTFAVKIAIPVTKSSTISFFVLKRCGGGYNSAVLMSIAQDDGEAESLATDGTLSGIVVPAGSASTVSLLLNESIGELAFKSPKIESSDVGVCNASLRGAARGGTLGASASLIVVNYGCKSEGKATLKLTVSIPPWDDAVAKWTKQCNAPEPEVVPPPPPKEQADGNGSSSSQEQQQQQNPPPTAGAAVSASAALVVAVAGSGIDVFRDNAPSESFSMEFNSLESIDDKHFVLPSTEARMRLVVANGAVPTDADDGARALRRATVTVSRPEVLKPLVRMNSVAVMQPTDERILEFLLACRRSGKVNVLVTIWIDAPTASAGVSSSTIEFGFVKQCRNPRKLKESGFMVTAKSYIVLLVVAGVVALAVFLYGGKRLVDCIRSQSGAAGARYQSASTTEN
uniref:Uncharacterized protein n=1 Tax=Erythrolobus madagascarensis TaxID=708628 RepID=A0A7S0XK10_9RHOD